MQHPINQSRKSIDHLPGVLQLNGRWFFRVQTGWNPLDMNERTNPFRLIASDRSGEKSERSDVNCVDGKYQAGRNSRQTRAKSLFGSDRLAAASPEMGTHEGQNYSAGLVTTEIRATSNWLTTRSLKAMTNEWSCSD